MDIESNLTLKSTTQYVSSHFLNMGVVQLTVKQVDNEKIFQPITQKSFQLNGVDINLADYEVGLKDNFLYLKNNSSYKISLSQCKPYIVTPIFTGYIEDIRDEIQNVNISILLLYLREITLDSCEKDDSNESIRTKSECGFWDTYYVYGTGGNKDVAEKQLRSEISDYGMEGCSAIGGTNTSCLWGEHGCVSSQAYCC